MIGLLLVGIGSGQDYRFPTSAEDYEHFYPTAYKDHDGVDWACGDVRYSGHQGSDFGGGSFDGMYAGRDITAAAMGVVSETNDGEYDECTSGTCDGGGGYGNFVRIRHPDGKETLYAHMRKHTVAVGVGEHVQCGDKLGEMGSSGYSTGPHLHFAVKGISGSYEDPFYGDCSEGPSYWTGQGDHGALPDLECDTPPACEPAAVLSCGESLSQRNDGAGSTDEHAFYGCTSWIYSGPEVAVSVATDRDETISLTLSGLSDDLDLYVLQSDACQAEDCLGSSDGSDTSDESMKFSATAGEYYTVIVDGYDGAVSDFTLSVDCKGALPVVPGDTGDTGGIGSAEDTEAPPESLPGSVESPAECGCQSGGEGGFLPVLLVALALLQRKFNADEIMFRLAS